VRYSREVIDEVRNAADIVLVVQEYVPLRRAGTSYKGLCPFHGERTPSFTVNRDKGFFHCFGCGQGGDVFKFVELQEGVGFQESVKRVASRFGITLPEPEASEHAQADEAEREALLKMHELAAGFFREQLASPAGRAAREMLDRRGLTQATVDLLGLGFAPAGRDSLLRLLRDRGFSSALIVRSGLGLERERDGLGDRFRRRLMFPIAREGGSVIGFGGRAMADDQVPKYLNSPETPLYTKGRVLYGLHLSRQAIRKSGVAVLVEGYFDVAQAMQGGVEHVLASSGTALTVQQAQLLRRFTSKVVLSFDADSAGQGAAAKSGDLLVAEGFQVAVALLPQGEDPDTYVQRHGGAAYQARIDEARPYLDFVIERGAAAHDLQDANGRLAFLNEMLVVAARIPDALARDQFADRLSHRARIGEDTVRQEIRKAAVTRQTEVPAQARRASMQGVTQSELELIVGMLAAPQATVDALGTLEDEDFEGLRTGRVLKLARDLVVDRPDDLPTAFLGRLTEEERRWVRAQAASRGATAPPEACTRTLRVLRLERERAQVERDIDHLQEQAGAAGHERIVALWVKKKELVQQIEALK
jgi:DNA primase